MGADEKSIFEKCGEVLINIKTKNRKTKIYTFNCAFCEVNCDQLKKFSIHLEKKHFCAEPEISDELEDKPLICEPDIKDEELNNIIDTKEDLEKTEDSIPLYEDPLKTVDPVKDIESADLALDMEIKVEANEMDYEDNDFNKDDMDYQDCLEDNDDNYSDSKSSDSEFEVKTKRKLSKLRKPKKVKVTEKKKGTTSNSKQAKTRSKVKKENIAEIDEKELSISLLKAFEKQTILWKVKERVLHNKDMRQYFEIVANEVNEKLKCNITWETAKKRIKKMRHIYTEEKVKKDNGEDYELPWYSDHMEFLQENVQALLKHRLKACAYPNLSESNNGNEQIYENLFAEARAALIETYALSPAEQTCADAYRNQTQKINNVLINQTNSCFDAANKTLSSNNQSSNATVTLIRTQLSDIDKELTKCLNISDAVLFLNCTTASKTMDESELSTLIDVYKKHESLWQVNNIGFGAIRNREHEFGKIANELSSDHGINVTADALNPRVNYMLRIYSENKRNQLECELKEREFKPSTPLYEKMTFLSEGHGPFKCSECNEIIERFGDYREHVSKHSDTIPFPCPLCKSAFYRYKHYVSHTRRHLELNYHFCKYCERGFASTSELRLHERNHTGENPYLCQICGATFKSGNSYDIHVRRHENRFRYVCHICNRGYSHMQRLNDHVKVHLNIRDVVCNVCGKTFTSKTRLKVHENIHSKEKRYKCQDCGKEFAQDAGLRQHRKQHLPFAAQRKKESSLNFDTVSLDFFKQ